MHTPILEKDGQRFIVNVKNFVGEDELEAMEIGIGAGFVECIIWGAKFTGDVLDIELAEEDDLRVTAATLGDCPVFLLDPVIRQS